MNRADIEDQYEVSEDGIITSPGKFEGEPVFAPAAYGLMLEGCTDVAYDEDGEAIDYFDVDNDFRAEFDDVLDEDTDIVSLVEDSQGFVHVKEWSKIDWDNFQDEFQFCDDDTEEWD